MDPACPWAELPPATIAFCERRLCALVAEPSNAWSNLAYLAAGLYLIGRSVRRRGGPVVAIGVASVLVGLGSFAFHATGTRLGEVLDVSAMYLLSCLGLVFALRRWLGLTAAAVG